ncbi:MAG: hypothetical protein L7G97_06645 [Acidilobus sp.]|nr:hypothetical protein [Acidilobus sp.]
MAQAWVGDRAREILEKEEKAKELLEANSLGFLAHRVHLAFDPYQVAQNMVEYKKRLEERLKPYLSKIRSVAFQKADNRRTFIYISRDLLPHDFMESDAAVIEMPYEDFYQKYKAKFIYLDKYGRPAFSALASKYYGFAKNYKVVLLRDHNVDQEIAATLSPNIYPISTHEDKPVYVGYALFIPEGDANA